MQITPTSNKINTAPSFKGLGHVFKKNYFLSTRKIVELAQSSEKDFVGTIEALRGFVACCPESEECGMVCVPGVYEKGAITGNPALEKARIMGENI